MGGTEPLNCKCGNYVSPFTVTFPFITKVRLPRLNEFNYEFELFCFDNVAF